MAERRPAGYPKLKNYKPSRFMLSTSHYDKAKADRAVKFIENRLHAGMAELLRDSGHEEQHRKPERMAVPLDTWTVCPVL